MDILKLKCFTNIKYLEVKFLIIARIFSDIVDFLAKLSFVRQVVLLGLILVTLVSAAVWVWAQDVSWGFVTLGFAALAWAALASSVAQISRSN